MKKIFITVIMLGVSLVTMANAMNRRNEVNVGDRNMSFNQFSMGFRGGVASLLQKTDFGGNWKPGYNVAFDLQYAYLFRRNKANKPLWGIRTGISVNYVSSSYEGKLDNRYKTTDASGDVLNYAITADKFKETDNQVQLQVPLMATMTYKGFMLNAGTRFAFPVYSSYKQTLDNAHITATYEKYGVPIKDDMLTGKFSDDQLSQKGKWDAPKFQLFLSAELGYSFTFYGGNCITVALYADYSVYNGYKGASSSDNSFVSVSQIGVDPANPCAQVTVNPIMNNYAKSIGYFDFGLRISADLNFYSDR